MPATIKAVSNAPDVSGAGWQRHCVYATNAAKWLVFTYDNASQSSLRCFYSSDLSTWTEATGSPHTLAHPANPNAATSVEGKNLAVAYAANGSTDVVHCCIPYDIASNGGATTVDLRATFSGTTITWGTESTAMSLVAGAWPNPLYTSANALIATDGTVVLSSGFTSSGNGGDDNVSQNATKDTAATWTAGAWTETLILSTTNAGLSAWLGSLGSGSMLYIADDSTGGTVDPVVKNWVWKKSAWAASATTILASALGTAINSNDWGAVVRTATDVHHVYRTGATAYTHKRWNGTDWTTVAGSTIPTSGLTGTVTGSGVSLSSDGANVWLFVVDGDANTSIKYIAWNGTSWDTSWTSLVGTAPTGSRKYVQAQQAPAGDTNKTIGVIWTEGSGTTYSLMSEKLATAAAADPFPAGYQWPQQVMSNAIFRM